MILLRAMLGLALALALQAGLGRLAPASLARVDLLLVPLAWYAVARGQRAAMLVGCAAGLSQDAWFGVTGFGINGFKKTLLGWLLGGIGARFDLNTTAGRFAVGAVARIGDALLDPLLRRLLRLATVPLQPTGLLFEALLSGLLVALAGGLIGRWRPTRPAHHPL